MADRHVDRRQVLRALLLAAAGLAVPAACGVPAGGGPIVDGSGPTYDPVVGGRPPPDPSEATTPKALVEGFLAAVSGPLAEPEQLKVARERARKFLTPAAKDAWKSAESNTVTVVRVDNLSPSTSGANTVVSGILQPVGVFARERGAVDPYPGRTDPMPVKFTVTPTRDGPRISELPASLPSGLLLSAAALDNAYFTPQVIYFWDNNKPWLVPDLRYVPSTGVVLNQQLTAIVKWLLLGPSPLISSVAGTIFPTGTDLRGPNADIQGKRAVLNFSTALQGVKGADLTRVLAQVQWSLHPLQKLSPGSVQLQIDSRQQQVPGDGELYRRVNPADERRPVDPQAFCVTDRVVQAVDGTLPAVLARSDYNRDVAKAALNRERTGAALVTVQGRLVLGRADDRGMVSSQEVDLRGQDWSRPVWLPLSRKLLIVVDGALLAVTASGAVSSPVAQGVKAFAVAPDGYRIGLVRQGVLQVASLHDDGDQQSLGDNPRPLDTGLSNLSAVAWSRMDRLVVAGRNEANEWRLAEITIDGAIRDVWNASFVRPIVSVVAYPKPPSQSPGPGAVMVQTEDTNAFRVFANASSSPAQPEPLTVPGPTPSPSGGTARNKPVPTAPFYPD
jgi:hypothetical protein